MSGRGHIPAEDRYHFAGDEARVGVRGEEDVNRRKLLRLTRPPHRGGSTELRNIFGGLRRGIQRGPDRTWSDSVDADFLLDEVLRERFRE